MKGRKLKPSILTLRKVVLLSLLLIFTTSCASTAKFTTTKLESSLDRPKILVFPIDVSLYELTMAGIPEPKADWTEKGKENVYQALKETLRNKNTDLTLFKENSEINDSNLQAYKFLKVVGNSIKNHHYAPFLKLPSKGDKFEWSVGNAGNVLKENYQADYALYVNLIDHYSSGGRVALGVVLAAAGVVLGSGLEHGTAYLIDLKTGEVVWFNYLREGDFGDIRELSGSEEAITNLFKNFPSK